jgi:hypothetical protein
MGEIVATIFGIIAGILGGGATFYFLSQHRPRLALWSGAVTVILIILTIAFLWDSAIVRAREAARAPRYFGDLTPGNEPEPPLGPAAPPSALELSRRGQLLQLMLGDKLRVLATWQPTTVLRYGDAAFLSINGGPDGIRLSATVVDRAGHNVVRIIENEFKASSEHAFNPRQPDPHSLIVRDSEGVPVLEARFLNRNTIRIIGRFHLPGFEDPVVVDDVVGLRLAGRLRIGNLTLDVTSGVGGVINFAHR